MTTIGVLGDASRLADLSILTEWADVKWGVDTFAEFHRHVIREPIDVAVVDASVAYVTDDLIALVPHHIGRVCVVADSVPLQTWVSAVAGVEWVRSFAEVQHLVESDTAGIGATQSADITPPNSLTVSDHHRTSRVVAVWGPFGSPGITTAAISMATVCASSGLRTVLCDLDSRGSSVAIALGLVDDTPGFAAACRLAGRSELTPAEIDRIAVRSDVGRDSITVLTGLPRASRWAEVDPHKARVVVELLRQMFDVVIADVGSGIEQNEWVDDAPQRDGAARDLLRRADAVIAVGQADAVGIARLIRGLDDLTELCEHPSVILNRVSPGDAADASDAIRRFSAHSVRAVVSRDSRGGVETARTRAQQHPAVWQRIAVEAGITFPTTVRSRWRR